MAKEYAKRFYDSNAWKKCRASYIALRMSIDGGMCEECHAEAGYIVHHTILLAPENINDPDVALNHTFLKYVCKKCHDEEEGHFAKRTKLLCKFDEDGQPIPTISDDTPPHLKNS